MSLTYCRRELAAYREPDIDEDEMTAVTELMRRLALGRCPSCAFRSHRCEGDGCNCPVPRCNR